MLCEVSHVHLLGVGLCLELESHVDHSRDTPPVSLGHDGVVVMESKLRFNLVSRKEGSGEETGLFGVL